jgi:hypothetical protein
MSKLSKDYFRGWYLRDRERLSRLPARFSGIWADIEVENLYQMCEAVDREGDEYDAFYAWRISQDCHEVYVFPELVPYSISAHRKERHHSWTAERAWVPPQKGAE